MKTCYDLYKEKGVSYDCCNSCHEDWEDFGIQMNFIEVDGVEYHVCCRGYVGVIV